MRIAALDLGDVWVGIALSDPLHMLARPYKTVKLPELVAAIQELISKEQVSHIVVGEPNTMRGTASEQTVKIREQLNALQTQFPAIAWHLWDERLTSKQASIIQRGVSLKKPTAKTGGSKEEKQRQHSVAAALILRSYLDHLAWKKDSAEL